MPQELSLQMVTRDDVVRIKRWLEDEEVSESWFGRYAYGDPAHLGYHPNEMDEVSDEEWDAVFDNPEHRMLSIYSPEAGHIGEVHLAIEESLGDGQLSILIGRKDLWHHGYGSAAARRTLETAFTEYGLYRVWVGHTGVQHRSPQHVLAPGLHARRHTAPEPPARRLALRLRHYGAAGERVCAHRRSRHSGNPPRLKILISWTGWKGSSTPCLSCPLCVCFHEVK